MTDKIADTFNWFAEAVPTSKITKRSQAVQAGVHFEEFVEMLECITIPGAEEALKTAVETLTLLANKLKKDTSAVMLVTNRKEFLDAMVDQIVTATGTAYQQGMDPVGGLGEINGSNWSKFKDGVCIFDENGKIAKNPETYYKANLTQFIGIDVTELENPPL